MKFLQILVLSFGLFVVVDGQVDCAVQNKVFVRDYDGNNIKNAKLDIYKIEKGFNKTFAFSPQKIENDTYFFISTMGDFRSLSGKFFYVSDSYWLKVTAENFKVNEQPIKFERCKAQELTVILEQINQKIKLTGVVYDINGAVIVGAKVKATNKNSESVEVKTNDEGIYLLNLLPEFYKIEVEQVGFKKLVIEGFQLINSTYGKMNKDIVLEVGEPSTPYAPVADNSQLVESQNIEVSDKILQKPLEKLPKEQNKTKK